MEFNPYELIYMSRTGDMTTVPALFSQYTNYIINLITASTTGYTPLRIHTDELVQECYISFYDAILLFRDDMHASFTTFMSVVLRRRIWNYLRRVRDPARFAFLSALSLDTAVNECETLYDFVPQKNKLMDPVYYTAFSTAADRVRRSIERLTPSDLEAYRCIARGDTYEEASRKLGVSTKTYDGKVQRIRRKIITAARGEKP